MIGKSLQVRENFAPKAAQRRLQKPNGLDY